MAPVALGGGLLDGGAQLLAFQEGEVVEEVRICGDVIRQAAGASGAVEEGGEGGGRTCRRALASPPERSRSVG